MIPLNKPGRITVSSGGGDFLADHFKDRNAYYLSTASDALNVIFGRLYEEHGSLRVGVSPLVCFQAIYPIVTHGHVPVFLDIDPDTFNIDTHKLAERDDIQSLALIHLGGDPNEMDVIEKYSKERGIPVIEDCAQAMGSTYEGRFLGNFGDYAAFSLIKNLHVPSGGLLLSKTDMSGQVAHALAMGKILGRYRKLKIGLESRIDHRPCNVWNWLYSGLLSLKQGASVVNDNGLHTLEKRDVDDVVRCFGSFETLYHRRLDNAEMIISGIDPLKAKVQQVPEKGVSNRNRVMFRLIDRDAEDVIKALRNKGIAANNLTQNYKCGFQPHVSGDHLLGRYFRKQELEVYDSVFHKIVAVPSSPFLTKEEIEHINHNLNEIIR